MIEFRINSESFVQTKIGLREFSQEQLQENFNAFMTAIVAKKPLSVKGKYIMKGMIKTSMGPPLKVDLGKYQQMASEMNL